ncbi:hypothetical protein COU01_00850 [Candidatus Falkowbacteria bacterium CG10_big_fil_rev_8_21_14_0_10_44_15]|uniref:Transcription regulator TrmB N-terminal domain-containing protein n=1 Tax=Candidatus Falkowbacteria bacterium CG10_big_fil_rev_8_21_14_0_10_44_15 TaxID=1974569 RepID=A0A2H0V0J4_9BACT|nr:MAG: hypothetical protein COU01_00850 [Candidatus Falkowbacteria bacterium CG10_big_fil_rev_8_21_14_0_10_44_15]
MTPRQILQKLEKFGFTPPQARLYLCGLQLGPVLMKPLAQTAQVSRSTAYYLMAELERRNFFTSRKVGKRVYYQAALPAKLLAMTQDRERLITDLLPTLQTITRS